MTLRIGWRRSVSRVIRTLSSAGGPRVGPLPGWIASADIAAVAAKVLIEGPAVHAGKGYWLSTDVLNGVQAAEILSGALGRGIPAEVFTPDEMLEAVAAGLASTPSFMEGHYAL